VERCHDGFNYKMSPWIADAKEGWNYCLMLLQAKLCDIGYLEPDVEDTELIRTLGKGGSAWVYEGNYKGQTVVVKVFRWNEEKESSFYAENSALRTLAALDVAGVPRIEALADVENYEECESFGTAILTTPLGKPFRTTLDGNEESIQGSHLRDLVRIVQRAHEAKIFHRDIKPNNLHLTDEGNIVLLDWGASTLLNDPDTHSRTWQGTAGFSVTSDEQEENSWSDATCDLVAVVRSAYVLVFKDRPPENFWTMYHGSVWNVAIELATNEDYEKLGQRLRGLIM
jgi:eukaryotic-like serine/threonine-protein kinase